MLRTVAISLIVFLCLIILSPIVIYWWSLSNIENRPIPSSLLISADQERAIWIQMKEIGDPSVKPISPYGYILYFYCEVNNRVNSSVCAAKYPGIKIAAYSIRKQVREELGSSPSNLKWQFTWLAYTIWVTRNWNTRQITSTYYESYNT